MFACAALGFIALGQTIALLLGGIDLSVGPLAGFLVVVGSFFVLDEHGHRRCGSSASRLMLGCAVAVGLFNGVAHPLRQVHAGGGHAGDLHRARRLRLRAARLRPTATSRPTSPTSSPARSARCRWPSSCSSSCALVLEWCLRRTQWGLRLRAVGSDEESARRVGVPHQPHGAARLRGASRALTFLGALVLLAQLGVGDPAQGTGYTLTSHHGRRARRHQPARRARHVHRHAAGGGPDRAGAERDDVPRPRPDLAVPVPGPR